MTKRRTIIVNLDRWERANVSRMGNPAYWIYGADVATGGVVRYRTATDTSCAYSVENWWARNVDRRNVTLVIEGVADKGAGRIVDMYRVEQGPNEERRFRA